MVRLGLLFALAAAVIGFVWHQLGQPVPRPPGPAHAQKLNCLSYAPFRGAENPHDRDLRVPDAQIEDDLERLADVASCIRTYSATGPNRRVVRVAERLGLKVLQGIWIGRSRAENRREIEAGLRLASRYPGVVEALIVGNEVLLRGELDATRMKAYLEEVRRRSRVPVTYADGWEFWLKAPELVSASDFVTIHILPYWEDRPVRAEDAAEYVRVIRQKIAEAFVGKDILIGEVGWPSAGRMRAGALPSPVNQALVLGGVVEAAKQGGWEVNLIEAFDQPWKRTQEGTVGGYWGVFDGESRGLKFRFGETVSNHPRWRLVAALGIGAAVFIFAAAWLGLWGRETTSWETGLAIAAIATISGLVFGAAALGLPMEPPELGDRLRSAAMLALALLAPMLAAVALVRAQPLPSLEVALNPPLWRRTGAVTVVLVLLFAATLVAAIHIALGLVFDPRYKDFQLLLLTGPVAAFAILAAARNPGARQPGTAETVAAALLIGSAAFVVVNEGIANRQAVWFGVLLVVLALTTLRISPAR